MQPIGYCPPISSRGISIYTFVIIHTCYLGLRKCDLKNLGGRINQIRNLTPFERATVPVFLPGFPLGVSLRRFTFVCILGGGGCIDENSISVALMRISYKFIVFLSFTLFLSPIPLISSRAPLSLRLQSLYLQSIVQRP